MPLTSKIHILLRFQDLISVSLVITCIWGPLPEIPRLHSPPPPDRRSEDFTASITYKDALVLHATQVIRVVLFDQVCAELLSMNSWLYRSKS